jgi:predicted amidohydrolase
MRVAVIQTRAIPGEVEQNLSQAAGFIRSAAAQGARLAVLPELSTSGCFPTSQTRKCAESVQGTTFQWMSALSRELRIWLGAGIVESDGKDHYSTYLLTQPDGELVAAVRKHNLEAHFWRPGKSPRVISTPFGNLGLAVCAACHCKDLLLEYLREGVDLVLMPHAWFIPAFSAQALGQNDRDQARMRARDMASLFSRVLGVSAVFVNHAGPNGVVDPPSSGLIARRAIPDPYQVAGLSAITDACGRVVAQLEAKPGYAVARVTLGAAQTGTGAWYATPWTPGTVGTYL